MYDMTIAGHDAMCSNNEYYYKTKCNALERELDDATKNVDRLIKQNKQYRKDRREAYSKGMTGDEFTTVKWLCLSSFLMGMVASLVIVMVILLFKGM